jgi:hypothetical protein
MFTWKSSESAEGPDLSICSTTRTGVTFIAVSASRLSITLRLRCAELGLFDRERKRGKPCCRLTVRSRRSRRYFPFRQLESCAILRHTHNLVLYAKISPEERCLSKPSPRTNP